MTEYLTDADRELIDFEGGRFNRESMFATIDQIVTEHVARVAAETRANGRDSWHPLADDLRYLLARLREAEERLPECRRMWQNAMRRAGVSADAWNEAELRAEKAEAALARVEALAKRYESAPGTEIDYDNAAYHLRTVLRGEWTEMRDE